MIPKRLAALREEMAKRAIDIYIIPTSDFHESEYVGSHFKAREYITGFTGSAGTAVVTMTEARLWTDGRYFVQAASQLAGSTVELMKMGEEGVPTIDEYIKTTLGQGQTLGFDGRVVNGSWGKRLKNIADEKSSKLYVDEDLVGIIWETRPALSKAPIMIFDEKYTGESTESKFKKVREEMAKKNADVHVMSSLYDIAWLLNVRGGDIEYVPVVLSYLAITRDTCIWFMQEEIINSELRSYLEANGISTMPYECFYDYIKKLKTGTRLLMNTAVCNYRICNNVPSDVVIIDDVDPTVRMKAIKNEIQIENIRNAHIKDAVAMIKFMYWLKKNVGKIPMTEISASDYLEELRREQEGCLDLSFDTICGYAAHGAIVHYSATPESDVELKPEGLLLVDSGGHYLEGTTDITRTFALGPVTDEMKADFTRVCRSNMNLANVKFKYGCTGVNLDIIARAPFWDVEMDYNHGTGHGVGFVLNVHEGPNAFRWQVSPGRSEDSVLEAGMITTDEPGLYIEGKYGIRTENELVCCKGKKTEYGQFMYFENLTYVPIDLDALDASQMSVSEKKYLNDYHKMVFDKMSPYFSGDQLEFLKEYTREV